jgi:LmbE family N-acetylglucosaminyl deacetylase
VTESLCQLNIDAILSHGSNGEYGHPAHVLTFQAAQMAVESLGQAAPLFYTVSAAFPGHPRPFLTNEDDAADLILDITPVLKQKTQAALCHRTQHALFVRRASEEAGRKLSVPEVILHLEGLHRLNPPDAGQPEDEITRLLRKYSLHQPDGENH